jgi:uncharacterized protein (TIGR03067 family)
MLARIVLLTAVAFLGSADEPKKKDETKKDQDLLQGEWTMVSMEMRGNKVAGGTVKQYKLKIDGDKWIVTAGEKASDDPGTFTIDQSKEPKTIDLKFKGTKESLSQGIYKLDGDTLTLCRTAGNTERPKEFKTTQEAGILVVWKRVKN